MTAVLAALGLSWRRVRLDAWSTLAVVVAMSGLVGLWTGVPLYAESAASRLLTAEIDDAAEDRIPLGYLFSYNRLSGGSRPWSDLVPVNDHLSDDTSFGGPLRSTSRMVQSRRVDLFRAADLDDGSGADARLARLSFVSLDDLSAMEISSGRLPRATASVIEIVVSDSLAERIGVAEGDDLVTATLDGRTTLEVRVVGTWTPPVGSDDTTERFLLDGITREGLIVREATMAGPLDGTVDDLVSEARWLVLLASDRIGTGDVDRILARTDAVNRAVDDRLGGTRLIVGPATALAGFRDEVDRLERGLSVVATPTILLAVVVTAIAIVMRRRRRAREMAVLSRRGVPRTPLLVAELIEALMIGGIAFVGGLAAGRAIAAGMGRTTRFLRWGDGLDLVSVFDPRMVRAAALATLVVVVLQVVPALRRPRLDGGSRASREGDGGVGTPWWQRGGVDLVVAAAIAAGAWFVAVRRPGSGDVLEDPSVVLVPALVALAGGIVVLRLTPVVLRTLGDLVARTETTAPLLGLRRAERRPRAIAGPLLLLVLTGSSAIYTASLARTLDLQLLDRVHHRLGGPAVLTPADPITTPGVFTRGIQPGPPTDAAAFERVWGLEAPTRIAALTGRFETVGGTGRPATVMAVDPDGFVRSAFWRDDYATTPLGPLMASLRDTPDGVLVARPILGEMGLAVGDELSVAVTVDRIGVEVPMVIVGSFDHFPTRTELDDRDPIVIDLADLEQRVGGTVPAAVVFERDPRASDDGQTRADLARVGLETAAVQQAADLVERERVRPERQGVFGLLSVGFVLSSALVLGGFAFHATVGFRDQATELGVLRALGLGRRSVLGVVATELLVLASIGLGAAVLLGTAMARWLLPRLVAGTDDQIPPVLAEVDLAATAGITIASAAAFVVLTGLVVGALRRMRLVEALKIGGVDV